MTRNKQKNLSLVLIVLIFLSLVTFLKFSQEVLLEHSVTLADTRITTLIYGIRRPLLTNVMLLSTLLADTSTIIVAVFVATILFFLQHRKTYALLLLGSSIGSYIFVLLAKFITQRERPSTMHAIITEQSFSFPSGHTLIAVAFYGLLAYFFMLTVKPVWAKICILSFTLLLVLCIGFSRIYLGVHWPSDVLASYIIGIGWLSFLILCLEHKESIKTFLLTHLPKAVV